MIPLAEVGAALYGSRWQTDLAAALGVTDRTVRRWVAAPASIPPRTRQALRQLCAARRDTLARLVAALDAAAATD